MKKGGNNSGGSAPRIELGGNNTDGRGEEDGGGSWGAHVASSGVADRYDPRRLSAAERDLLTNEVGVGIFAAAPSTSTQGKSETKKTNVHGPVVGAGGQLETVPVADRTPGTAAIAFGTGRRGVRGDTLFAGDVDVVAPIKSSNLNEEGARSGAWGRGSSGLRERHDDAETRASAASNSNRYPPHLAVGYIPDDGLRSEVHMDGAAAAAVVEGRPVDPDAERRQIEEEVERRLRKRQRRICVGVAFVLAAAAAIVLGVTLTIGRGNETAGAEANDNSPLPNSNGDADLNSGSPGGSFNFTLPQPDVRPNKVTDPSAIPSSSPSLVPTPSPTLPRIDAIKNRLVAESVTTEENLLESSNLNPQRRALEWISDVDGRKVAVDSPFLPQRYVLAVLYFSTDGENWIWALAHDPTRNTTFLGAANECAWYLRDYNREYSAGVGCNEDGFVNTFTSHSGYVECCSKMAGTIPTELVALKNLTSLDLNAEKLIGTLPKELANLEKLRYLGLSSNNLSGTLPPEWSGLTNIRSLNLDRNGFTGTVPREWGSLRELERLHLGYNELTGQLEFNYNVFDSLRFLAIHQNRFTGSVPWSICRVGSYTHLWADCSGSEASISCGCCTRCCDGVQCCDVNSNPAAIECFDV